MTDAQGKTENKFYSIPKEELFNLIHQTKDEVEGSEEYAKQLVEGISKMWDSMVLKGFLNEHLGLIIETDSEGVNLINVHMAYKGLPLYDESVVEDFADA